MKFIRRDGKVYGKKSKDSEEVYLFDNVVIKNIILNVNTGDIKAELAFEFAEDKKLVSVPRSAYQTKKGLLPLQDKGLGVTEENAKYMIQYLKEQESNMKIKKVHHMLGYDKANKSFRIYDSIPNESTYDGELDIEPKGTFNKWLEMYDKNVKGRKELEFIILVGLSSAIIGMIGKAISMENPIVHIYGDSSSGKTTAVQLALSSWGNPSLRVNGLIQTFNETINSLMHNLNDNNGIPMCFDEISMSSAEDFTSLIYSVSNGKEKGRLINEIGKGYVKAEQKTWNTVIISTGEYNILERAKENDGLKVRVYAIGGVQWTKDASMSDEIKKYVFNNYGYFASKFANTLMELGEESLIARHEKELHALCRILKKRNIHDEFTDRRAKYYAVLTLAHNILNSSMELGMDLRGIFSMIENIERESIKERNVGEQAYNKFLEEISKNRRKFPIIEGKRNRGINKKEDVWGYVLRKDRQAEIFPEDFKRICRNLGFQSHSVILKKWKVTGKLDHESDRNHRERNGANVYVINLNKGFIDSIDGTDNEIDGDIRVIF